MRAPLLALLCLSAGAAPAQAEAARRPAPAAPPAAPPATVVAAMPAELPFWRRDGGVADFEARPGGAGYGASVRYVGQRGLRGIATVFVYDRGAVRQPDGAAAPSVTAELASAVQEIREIAATGRYTLLAEPTPMTAGPATGPGGARCALVPLRQPDGETTQDAICVTIHDRRFLKTRVTLRDDPNPRRAGIIAFALMGETTPGLPAPGNAKR